MKLVLALLLAVSVVAFAQQRSSTEPPKVPKMSYGDFKKKFKKSDGLLKSSVRSDAAAEKTYNENCANIEQHNKKPNETYKQGISSNADMTAEDISKTRKGFKLSNETSSRTRRQTNAQNNFNISSATNLKSPMVNAMDLRR